MGEMNVEELVEKIAEKDFDVDEFVQIALMDDEARDEIVHQMISNAKIMVYYHCYYVASKASKECPELFYKYWDEISELLHHENSYHRDFAIDIIGNLTKIDRDSRFSEIEDEYFARINDKKFMTGNNCVRNLRKVYKHKEELRERIIALLLDIDNQCEYTEKQKGVLKCDVLEIFEEFYDEVEERDEINEFISAEVDSISPKTRKKARELVRAFGM